MASNNILSNFFLRFIKKFLSVEENTSELLPVPRKILVIRQHNQLGDLLAGVSIFRALKEKFPNAKLILLTSIDNYYGAQKNKFIDELYVFNKYKMYNPIKLFSFFRFLRQEFDLVIVPVTVSISFTSNLLARISNSKIRIGPKSLDGKPNESAFLFDRRVDVDWRKYPDSNVAEHILEIVKPFGIFTKDFSSVVSFDNNDVKIANEFLSKIDHNYNSKLIGLHVGAGKPPNRWSLNKYVELISDLNDCFNCSFYLTGSDADREDLDYVTNHSTVKINKFINQSIAEIAALISLSDLFISNDTGIMHVAGTTDTPLISLFGPTNPFNWAPCGKDKIFIRKSDLIDDIQTDDVFKICQTFLVNNNA
jgi:ADP-heptose:LPS heptosyltransferase